MPHDPRNLGQQHSYKGRGVQCRNRAGGDSCGLVAASAAHGKQCLKAVQLGCKAHTLHSITVCYVIVYYSIL